MKVRFRKSPAGKPHVISCRRDDGTETYGPIPPQPGVPHDIIHYCVESTLGLRRAFFGTVASGVAIPDAADRWKTLGPEAKAESARAEQIVAWFQNPTARMPTVPASPAELAAIEAKIAELYERWQALGDKDAFEVDW